ncbi:hypothetical protein J7T55_011186 [Diaporthe amygdali]|uniref:uncharacterized protein n=1 Tax=Phomopsis amygdali TaxID=1214568 RepID=UPI0022FDF76B|nr:uncharacterized protein J7T55_011186 [Diaporthe amygdali]KAJ0108697.1 hypothetical protein J7T55_011186 [Diaporthe amygdali]
MPFNKEPNEIIDLTSIASHRPPQLAQVIDLTMDHYKLEAIVRFYQTALEKATSLIDPDSMAEFTRLSPQPTMPDATLPVQHAYYKAAVNNAGSFLNDTRRHMDQIRRDDDEGAHETWTKGASVMLRVSFGRFIKSSAMFFPMWMNPMLSEIGINLLAHESKGVSRLDPTMMLACLGLDTVNPPLVYFCEPHEFIVTWLPDKDGCEQEPLIDIPDSVWEKARSALRQGRDYRDWARVGRDLATRYQFIKEFGIERAMEFEHAQGRGYKVDAEKVRELHGAAWFGGGKAFGADGTPLWKRMNKVKSKTHMKDMSLIHDAVEWDGYEVTFLYVGDVLEKLIPVVLVTRYLVLSLKNQVAGTSYLLATTSLCQLSGWPVSCSSMSSSISVFSSERSDCLRPREVPDR